MTISERLAEFAVGLSYESIPDNVVSFSKNMILDLIGNTLGGFSGMEPQQIIAAVKSYDRSPVATIWGDGSKVSSPSAALANTASAEGNDFTFGNTAIIPTAISVGEDQKADGRTILTAIVAAYEVIKRVGSSMHDPTLHKNGFYWPWLPLGAVIAAGKVLNLTKEQMTWALGNAGSSGAATFIPHAEGVRTKLMFHGMAAVTGIVSCHLAKQGFRGPLTLFEIEETPNFFKLYSYPNFDPSKATYRLGEFLLNEAVLFKPYPACRASHSSIDGAFKIVKEHNPKPEDIDKIIVRLSERDASPDLVGREDLETEFDAQFNVRFLVAATIAERNTPTLDLFTPEKIKDPKILQLVNRVEVVGDPELSKIRTYPRPPFIHPSRLLVKMKDGREYGSQVDYFKGSPKNPPTDEEIRSKFENQARRHLPAEQINQIYSMVRAIQEQQDVRALTKMLHV